MHGDGHILGETSLGAGAITVLQLSSPLVTPGFSGAPLFDTVTGRVSGMVTAIADPDRHGRMGETAFITPSETLRAICPELQLSDICPYRGLAAFTEADARFFHGRTALVARLVVGGSLQADRVETARLGWFMPEEVAAMPVHPMVAPMKSAVLRCLEEGAFVL
jgi:S1-C subfamily serine protease